jgi:5-methyltetrahydrofolate--homocysteine methyltransferase
MVHVAHEMKRRSMKQPLLIGGATTSRMHTAVKIAPQYENGVVHVLDASRSVTVAGSLLSKEQKPGYLANVGKEYQKLRDDFSNKKTAKQYLTLAQAQQNKVVIDWNSYTPPTPQFTGTKIFENYDLNELVDYIDWGPFFIAWELHGKFPAILKDEKVGKEATKLFADANALLKKIINEKWLTPRGVIGFWPASSDGKDSVFLYDESGKVATRLESLRQQSKKAAGQPNFSLTDFIKPVAEPANGKSPEGADYMGAFSVTIQGIEPHLKIFVENLDDYNKIMLQVLADRLAEAFAELLHERVRKEFWGYVKDETLSNEELIKESYSGIRPAPGYPACPDHTEKYKLFNLLGGEQATGITLTESLAMYPASSICGWYFAHPQSQYFGLGKILKDQVIDYANRKNMAVEDIERWLRPVLEYDV